MRDLSPDFLAAMREKLEFGRIKGHRGWDEHWKDCGKTFHPTGPFGFLMRRLREEVGELTEALTRGDKDHIRSEAADVANMAMMVADIEGALRDWKGPKAGPITVDESQFLEPGQALFIGRIGRLGVMRIEGLQKNPGGKDDETT